MLSFHGQPEVKRAVLSQMHQHIKDATMGDITVGKWRLHLYGWQDQVIDYATCEVALGIPQDLLRLGVSFFEGFPDGDDGVREVVRTRRRFVKAIPVGVDLTPIATRFLLWLLFDAKIGPACLVDDPLMVEATLRVTELLSNRLCGPTPDGEARAALDAARVAEVAAAADLAAVRTPEARERAFALGRKQDIWAEERRRSEPVRAAQALAAAARYASGDAREVTEVSHCLVWGHDGVSPHDDHAHLDDRFAEELLALLREAGTPDDG